MSKVTKLLTSLLTTFPLCLLLNITRLTLRNVRRCRRQDVLNSSSSLPVAMVIWLKCFLLVLLSSCVSFPWPLPNLEVWLWHIPDGVLHVPLSCLLRPSTCAAPFLSLCMQNMRMFLVGLSFRMWVVKWLTLPGLHIPRLLGDSLHPTPFLVMSAPNAAADTRRWPVVLVS